MASTKPGDGNAQKLLGGCGQTTDSDRPPGVRGSSRITEALDGAKACWNHYVFTELQNNQHMLLSKSRGQSSVETWKSVSKSNPNS